MPRRKSTDSLKNLCINSVASNMDYWCKDYIDNFAGPKTLYIISPFDCLPHGILLNLLAVLKEQKLLKRPHLDLILHSNFDYLDLADSTHLDISHLVNLIGRTCSNLQFLDISHCGKIPRSAFLELPSIIPNIIVLKLRSTGCFDGVLAQIGRYCCEMRELDVSWNQISDTGISSLCVNMDDIQTGIPKCQKLEILSINGTKVTNSGVICALKNLPFLKKLDCHNSFKALETIHFNDFMQQNQGIKKYLLQTMTIESDNDSVSIESLKFISELCPNVTVIEITNANISNECLIQLCHFKHIQQLELTNSFDGSISFSKGISPLLQICGQTLFNLSLAEFSDVDLNVIGYSCPNLQCLKLFYASSYKISSFDFGKSKNFKMFENLKNLQIVCIENTTVPAVQLQKLLSHCLHVDYIFIQYCDSLDDEIITNTLLSNPLNHLMHLELEYCNNITATSILALLNTSNPLKIMKLTWCKSITRMDFEYFQELIQKENFNTSIEWM